MNVLDKTIYSLAHEINKLTTRQQAALFVVCALGLRPAYQAVCGNRNAVLINTALQAGKNYALQGTRLPDLEEQLAKLAGSTPLEGWPQEFWICLDMGLRLQKPTPDVDAGICIEYALQPLLEATCERLYGFSDPGSENEREVYERVFQEAELLRGLDFCQSAIRQLAASIAPTARTIRTLSLKARMLLPARLNN